MNVMVDLETMGVDDSAAIVSIGAVEFNKDKIGSEFYRNITLYSNQSRGRTYTPSTIEWWLKQDKAAQEGLFNPTPVDLLTALKDFQKYVTGVLSKNDGMWANGVTFDLIILSHAFKAMNVKKPWHFRNECCVRPLRKIGYLVGLKYEDYYGEGVAHNALDDAKLQAKFVQDFIRKMESNK